MRIVIQRVKKASVHIHTECVAEIHQGMLILLGIEEADDQTDIEWLCTKISNLRIFDDKQGVMNLSINQIEGDILLVSQFTLHASTKKGARPSYIKAAHPDRAIPLYQKFIQQLQQQISGEVKTGVFGAEMDVELINHGPVTIIIDSKNRE
ncbi:MAG: D-tyrosyl-tRNA(Tyr) deacylase [Bacteroidales bacterium]|nr:D-tyrosyl-tRNA(Tyr) deacylase [Bacteroidales bacterium]